MVQGDEPLLMPEAVSRIAQPLLDRADVVCANLLSPLESDIDLNNPNIVKAACDQQGRVMFLSRSPIPHFRKRVECPIYRQTGIMAFRTSLLRKYSSLPETPFERAEAIDMLRLLEHGYPIHGVVVNYPTLGVDRPEDVPLVESRLREDPVQRRLYERIAAVAR
jgi:3-deoxy-manno-octulosonate cytidylyltransferase (CMP-KDO synthetase)